MLELLDGVLCYSEDELNQETGVRRCFVFLGRVRGDVPSGVASLLGELVCTSSTFLQTRDAKSEEETPRADG